MIYLSNAALNYAIEICQEKEKYLVGIALDRYYLKNSIYKKLREYLKESDNILKIYNTQSQCSISFKNGSQIKIIGVNDNCRGYAFHLLIADENISDKIVDTILLPCEKMICMEKINKLLQKEE